MTDGGLIYRYQLYRDGLDDHRAAEGYDDEIPMPALGGPPLFSIGVAAVVAEATLKYFDELSE